MNLGIENRVAIVTGASSGIGKATALSLAKEGVKVILVGRNANELEKQKMQINHWGGEVDVINCDLREEETRKKVIDKALKRFSRIDIIVNCAFEVNPVSTLEAELTDWKDMFNLGLYSLVDLCKMVIPSMKMHEWGRIINVSSSSVKSPSGNAVYDSVKAAIVSYSKNLSNELASENILVNSVCPGSTLTPMWKGENSVGSKIATLEGLELNELLRDIEQTIPLGRLAEPTEIADLITFLCSDRAAYITGQAIFIDGGSTPSPY